LVATRQREQITITQLISPLLACSFVLSPMILLTVDAAISNEFAGCAHLEFHVIDFRFAARGATHHLSASSWSTALILLFILQLSLPSSLLRLLLSGGKDNNESNSE
jgi:hypothetical protein